MFSISMMRGTRSMSAKVTSDDQHKAVRERVRKLIIVEPNPANAVGPT